MFEKCTDEVDSPEVDNLDDYNYCKQSSFGGHLTAVITLASSNL